MITFTGKQATSNYLEGLRKESPAFFDSVLNDVYEKIIEKSKYNYLLFFTIPKCILSDDEDGEEYDFTLELQEYVKLHLYNNGFDVCDLVEIRPDLEEQEEPERTIRIMWAQPPKKENLNGNH